MFMQQRELKAVMQQNLTRMRWKLIWFYFETSFDQKSLASFKKLQRNFKQHIELKVKFESSKIAMV